MGSRRVSRARVASRNFLLTASVACGSLERGGVGLHADPLSLIVSDGAASLGKFEKGNQYRFKPGKSGNPGGRPKNVTMEDIALRLLDEQVAGLDGTSMEKLELLTRVVIDKAIRDRDVATISLLMKRLWPEVNKHELSGTVGIEQQVADAAAEFDRLMGRTNAEREPVDDERTDPHRTLN